MSAHEGGPERFDRRLASVIDHTCLRPEATGDDVARLCEEARRYGFATVCVQPIWVPAAARLLDRSTVKVGTVAGFPHGGDAAEAKACETRIACGQGAREIDMVIPIGALRGGDPATVAAHIRAVRTAAPAGVMVKVILETGYLSRDQKIEACRLAREEGADFVKTSTGFGPSGATVEDVRLLREAVGGAMGVKAAGGIRDRQTALAMLDAGATRLGASASVRIVSSA